MTTSSNLSERLLSLIAEECNAHGYSLHPIKWYADRLGCKRLDIKTALELLTKKKLIRRTTYFDKDNIRRVKLTAAFRKGDETWKH